MMIHGYCETCHKFRRIRLRRWSQVTSYGRGVTPMPVGQCSSCEDERTKART